MPKKLSALVLVAFTLAGCATGLQTAGLGAAVGAVGASAVGGNAATGAVIGGLAGAACYQTNTCP